LRNSDADIDIHSNHARNDGNGIRPAEDLPRRYISQSGDGGGVIFLDTDLREAIKDRPVGVAVIMVSVRAEVKPGDWWNNPAENVGIALNPRTGAELSGTCMNIRKED
jgi:hypothetical protein